MSNELTTNSNQQLPTYVQKLKPYDMTEINRHAKPPFIKWINPLSEAPYKPPFNDGDIIVAPQMIKIGDFNTPFSFVPLFFFTHFQSTNPRQLKGSLPFVREITFDENSELAKKCKKFVEDEKCPEDPKYYLKYSQVLNFFVILEDHQELCNLPIWIPFARGEFATGRTLLGLIQGRGAHPFVCRFRAASGIHPGKKGKWVGLNISNDPQMWVQAEENALKYERMSFSLKELVEQRALDLSDDTLEENEANESRF